ncbi:MAG: MFS transporter [Bacteroidales bacterium]|nr:MFS transporter [Bacteroidales bacterium]
MPVIYLFYNENGFSTTELFGLHAIYSIVIAVLEVPSGYFADACGKKTALVTGTFLGVLGFSAYSVSHTLTGFIIAEILLGIGESFVSGADSAILYDTLAEQKKEKNYLKTESRLSAVGNASEALAGLFVSLVVFQTVRINFFLQTILTFIAFIAACFLIEPHIHIDRKKPGFGEILGIVGYTFRENRILGKFVVFSAIIGYSSLLMAWFAQPIFNQAGLDKNYYGYAWVVLNSLVAAGSLLALKINHFLGAKAIFVFIAAGMSVFYLLVALEISYLAFIPMAVFYIIRGSAHPILKNYINNHTPSDKRATVLSLRSLLIRILYSSTGPFLGVVSDTISLSTALYLCGTSIFISAMVFAFLILREHYNNLH